MKFPTTIRHLMKIEIEENSPLKLKKINVKDEKRKVTTCRRCLVEFTSRHHLTIHNKIYHPEEKKDVHPFEYDEEKDIYTCSTCSAEFQTQNEIEEHISKIHEESYTCEMCQHISKKAYSFAVHMKTHSTDDIYTCPLCDYKNPIKTNLRNHMKRVHYPKFNYTCVTCGKGFNNSVIFNEHNNGHLGIPSFICVVCNTSFKHSRYMLIHQTRYHTVHTEGILHKSQCSICLKVFNDVTACLKHIDSTHNSNSSEKRHLCHICGKSLCSAYKLKKHHMIHTSEKPYCCSHCEMRFTYKHYLTRHERIHTGEKPHCCRYCEKRFTKKQCLTMHERVHTGEKPFACKFCDKCFNQATSLRIHVRGHTGERPYICQFCNEGYISRASLNLHLKTCKRVT